MSIIVKIAQQLIEVGDDDPLLVNRVNYGMHGLQLQHIADALHAKYPGLSVINACAGAGESVALFRHRAGSAMLCLEPEAGQFGLLALNTAALDRVEALRLDLQAVPSAVPEVSTLDQLIVDRPAFNASRVLISAPSHSRGDVLRGGWNWLRAARPALYFTISPRDEAQRHSDVSLVHSLLGIGYQHFLLFDDHGHLSYQLDRTLEQLPHAVRALRSSITHGGRLARYFVLALQHGDADLIPGIVAALDAQCADAPATRVAVVRLDNLGDHVLGSGLFRVLRNHYPGSRVCAVVPRGLVQLYARCPYVDHVITVPRREEYLRDSRQFAHLLAQFNPLEKFDVVINPRFADDHYGAGAIARALAAGDARVIGFRQASSPLPHYDPNSFFSELLDAPDALHASRYTELLLQALAPERAAVDPELWWTAQDEAAVARRYGLKPRQYVVLGCGASFAFKRPALEVYHHIVGALTQRWRRRLVLVGTAAERPLADALLAGAEAPSAILSTLEELPLYELAALLHGAELYIGPDAGPMHMAAAAGTRVIELGWVPADYPARSRGHMTGGSCWAPWSARAISVRPSSGQFYEQVKRPGWMLEPIAGLSLDQIDRALAQLLDA